MWCGRSVYHAPANVNHILTNTQVKDTEAHIYEKTFKELLEIEALGHLSMGSKIIGIGSI